MELKRYVQIRKEVFEVEEVIFNTDNYVQFKAVNENHKRTIYKGDGYKTSDSILDLVEVGDLVELDNEWEILKILRFSKNNNIVCMVYTSSSTEEYEFYDYRNKRITAIYKLQPNGDYKKYEVKEWKSM